MQQSTVYLHFRGIQRRCMGSLVARHSCLPGLRCGSSGRLAGLVLSGGVNLTAGQVRSASECILVVALHRQTQNSPVWHSGLLNSYRHTKHDKTVVSGMVV